MIKLKNLTKEELNESPFIIRELYNTYKENRKQGQLEYYQQEYPEYFINEDDEINEEFINQYGNCNNNQQNKVIKNGSYTPYVIEGKHVKGIVLTDFNEDYWQKFDFNNIVDVVCKKQDEIKEKPLIGELYNENIINYFDISLLKASFTINKIWFDNKVLYANIKFLDTPCGHIAAECFIKHGITKFKMRGSFNGNELNEIITWDLDTR